jgi:hypothetical protein
VVDNPDGIGFYYYGEAIRIDGSDIGYCNLGQESSWKHFRRVGVEAKYESLADARVITAGA